MIVRIVKMSFNSEQVPDFLQMFDERKKRIRSFEGCQHLELWQDADSSNIFFTYSIWDSEQHLNKYRFSELFKETWSITKAMFCDKPQAWSLLQKTVVSKS